MHLDWSTLALQTVNVLVLLWLLRRYLFRPVAEMIAARRRAAEALLAEAAEKRRAAEAAAEEIARREQGLAAEAEQQRAAAEEGAAAERARLLAVAEADIARIRAEAASAIRRDRTGQRRTLEAEARDLAATIAARLLARVPGAAVSAAMLTSLAPVLAALPAEQRAALGGEIEVASAAALSPTEQDACTALLGRVLSPPPVLRFRVDPRLLAGIELHGTHAVLRQSWRAELERLAHELRQEDEDVAPVLA